MRIEPIKLETVEEVYLLAIKLLKESRYDIKTIDPQTMINTIVKSIALPNIAYGSVLINDDEKIIGYLLGYIAKNNFGLDLVAVDESIYLLPEYRGRLYGRKLLKHFEEWCIARGVKAIRLTTTAGINVEKTLKLFTLLGYDYVGGIVEKEL